MLRASELRAAILLKQAIEKTASEPPVRSSEMVRRYPIECPTCGMMLHQNHAEIYGECVLCGGKVREQTSPNIALDPVR